MHIPRFARCALCIFGLCITSSLFGLLLKHPDWRGKHDDRSRFSAPTKITPLSDRPIQDQQTPSSQIQSKSGLKKMGSRTAALSWLRDATASKQADWLEALDAGSGMNSLPWLAELTCAKITAVTASAEVAKMLHEKSIRGAFPRPNACVGGKQVPTVVLGSWADPNFLANRTWDLVLVDLLLGSVEAYSPFMQWPMLAHLASSLRSGGHLLFTGLEPLRRDVSASRKRLENHAKRFHDIMLLLAGRQPYREYPEALVAWELNRSGLVIEASARFNTSPSFGLRAATASKAAATAAHQIGGFGAGVAEAALRLGTELRKATSRIDEPESATRIYVIVARRP